MDEIACEGPKAPERPFTDVQAQDFGHLPLGRYRLRFVADESLSLPAYTGSMWRGAFGEALKRTLCVSGLPDCAQCLFQHHCPHAYLFETSPPPGADRMRLYNHVPHPYVLDPEGQPRALQRGEYVTLGLTLVGRGNQYLREVLVAFARCAQEGVGAQRRRLRLDSVLQEENMGNPRWLPIYHAGDELFPLPLGPLPIPEIPARISIAFRTPLRLREHGRNVVPDTFRFRHLFASVLRRISMLSYFHGEAIEALDYRSLIDRSATIEWADRQLRWQEWTRYSSRQKTKMAMGGLTGRCQLESDGLDAFWPFLWAGQWVHAGKGTTLGLGKYRIGDAEGASWRQAGMCN